MSVLHKAAHLLPLARRAALVTALLPEALWYTVARHCSRIQARVSAHRQGRPWGVSSAYLLDHWMRELTRHGTFPVPQNVEGQHLLTAVPGDTGGVLLTGTHVPCNHFVLRAAIVTGHCPDLVISSPDTMTDQAATYNAAGRHEPIPAVCPGASAMLRVRTLLRQPGRLVASHLDQAPGAAMSASLLRLVGRTGARCVLYHTLIDSAGTIHTLFYPPPYPFCRDEAEIHANLEHMREQEKLALRLHDARSSLRDLPSGLRSQLGCGDSSPTTQQRRSFEPATQLAAAGMRGKHNSL